MPRGRPKKISTLPEAVKTHKEQPTHVGCPYGCSGTISALKEQAEFLREQVRSLQDKLLCLVPEAADREHRLRLTHMTNSRPEAMNGIVPMENTLPDDDGMGEFFNHIDRLGTIRR